MRRRAVAPPGLETIEVRTTTGWVEIPLPRLRAWGIGTRWGGNQADDWAPTAAGLENRWT